LSEEWHQDLKDSYRPEEEDFPQLGDEKEELLAYQIDQRVTSFMYSPGMQKLLDRVDENLMHGARLIEEGTNDKIATLNEQHQADRDLLVQKLGETRRTLWGLGGMTVVGGIALAAVALWPKIRDLISSRLNPGQSEETMEIAEDEDGEFEVVNGKDEEADEDTKNYFKWKRDRWEEIQSE
jgi:hypothetical protein